MSAPRLAAAFGFGSAARGAAEEENVLPERGAGEGKAAETGRGAAKGAQGSGNALPERGAADAAAAETGRGGAEKENVLPERGAAGEGPLVLDGGGAILQEEPDARDPVRAVGLNTGNLLFMSALQRIFPAPLLPHDYRARGIDPRRYRYIVLSDLIWIRPHDVFPAVERLLEDTDARILPLSVGLQAPSCGERFRLHPRTVRLLARLQERALLGARGEYTAAVLADHGIRNVQPVGCPSLYWPLRRDFRVEGCPAGGPVRAAANFRTFYGRATHAERVFLRWCADRGLRFVEQTEQPVTEEFLNGDAPFFAYIRRYLRLRGVLFADEAEWRAALSAYDFSIGMRFHGNVMAVRCGKPALFLRHDSRTAELIDFFRLPALDAEDFDGRPLGYYGELADYSAFNAAYPARFDAFVACLRRNGFTVREG